MRLDIKTSIIVASLLCNVYAQESNQLDTITVTAQKVEQDMQHVPISINVVDEFLIEDKNIDKMEDLTKITPSFSFVNQGTSGVGSPTIRGLHGDFHNFNTPIVMFVDGVPILNGLGYNTAIFDVQRVEILKGPQGTLYGKNAQAGVINIISKKPSNEIQGKLAFSFASNNKKEVNAIISGPLIKDKLYAGISFRKSKKDGFLNNTNLDKKVGSRENIYGKVNLRATPNDNLEVSLISSLVKYDDTDSLIGLTTAKNREVKSDLNGFNKSITNLNSLKIQYKVNDLKLESISSYRKYKDNAQQDWDFSNPSDPKYQYTYHEKRPNKNNFTTIAQEFRISSSLNNIHYLAGLYLDKDKVNFYSEQIGTTNVIHDPIDSKSIGIFAHLTYDLNEKVSILGGIRYDKEKKEHTGYKKSKSFDAISPKLALNYSFNKSQMAYINIAKGYRAGGFNTSSSQRANHLNSFEQESLLSYELGMKNKLLKDKLLVNFSLYYMDIADMQVKTALSPFEGYTSNAGKSTSKGLELEVNYKINDSFTFFTSLGLNKTQFEDFEDNIFSQAGIPLGIVNHKGNENIYSPKYNYNIGLSYRNSDGYFARADISGFSSIYTDKENKNKVPAYNLVDTKIGYETQSYEIHLYAKNLFNKEHNINGYNSQYVIYSQPREIGVQLTYRF